MSLKVHVYALGPYPSLIYNTKCSSLLPSDNFKVYYCTVYVLSSTNKEQWLTTAVWSGRTWLEHVWPGRHGRLLRVCRRICTERTCWLDCGRPRRSSLCASRFAPVCTSALSTHALQATQYMTESNNSFLKYIKWEARKYISVQPDPADLMH